MLRIVFRESKPLRTLLVLGVVSLIAALLLVSPLLAMEPPPGMDPPTDPPSAPPAEGEGAPPGDEGVILPPTEDTVYEEAEPNGYLSCIDTDPETGEPFTADYANDEILASFTADATMTEIETAFAAIGAHKRRYIAWCVTWVAALDVPAATCAELQAKVDLLGTQSKVTSASKNQRVEQMAVPNDPLYPSYQWNLPRIGVNTAWDTEKGKGAFTTIGVIDTGIDKNHPDFQCGNLRYESDWHMGHYHGTACSGIINACTNNSIGVAGVVWNGQLISKYTTLTWSDIKTKIGDILRYSTSTPGGVVAISMSFGGGSSDPASNWAVNNALERGVLPVASAGNSDARYTFYPAGFLRSMAVGATDQAMSGPNQLRAHFPGWWGSTWGPHLSVMAPGVNITTTTIGGGYTYSFGGTSAACPHVAGLTGLVRSEFQSMAPLDIRHRIEDTASDAVVHLSGQSPISGFDEYTGWGFIQAQNAVASDATANKSITRNPWHLMILPVWPKENPNLNEWQKSAFVETVLPTAAQVGASARYIAHIKPSTDEYYRQDQVDGNGYPLLGTVRPYKAFFVKYTGGSGDISISSQGARAGKKTAHQIEFPLWYRWNMFGNPFFENITLSDNNIRVRRVVKSGETVTYDEKSLSQAVTALWISRKFWYWVPYDNYGYYVWTYYSSGHTMPPYRGYFLYSNKPHGELYLIIKR